MTEMRVRTVVLLGLPPGPVELDQLDHVFGAGARINKGVDSIASYNHCENHSLTLCIIVIERKR